MKFFKQIGILLFIFCIPVAIILFLNFFGKSHFDVPIFYENGVDRTVEGCFFDSKQHQVPSFSLNDIRGLSVGDTLLTKGLSVIHFVREETPAATVQQSDYQIERTLQAFEHLPQNEVKVITLKHSEDSTLSTHDDSGQRHHHLYHPDEQYLDSFLRCGLIMDDSLSMDEQFVLVDNVKRIRGYYHALNPEEVDRLIVEMKIILEN